MYDIYCYCQCVCVCYIYAYILCATTIILITLMYTIYPYINTLVKTDVKPENILISANGYIKLTDFGVAKAVLNLNECYATSGTHGYMVSVY